MLNGALISRNLSRLLGRGPGDLAAQAIDRRELCPAEEVGGVPAIYPEGALDRISALSPWRDWNGERDLIEGAPVRHAATEALTIPDVTLAGAYLYRGSAKERIGSGSALMLDPDLPPRKSIPEAHLVSTWTGADFFGNFIQDTLALELIPKPGDVCVAAPTKPYLHEDGYRELLGLPAPAQPRHARIGRLVMYRDFAQNSYKRGRYDELRARLRAAMGIGQQAPGVFLRRGSAHGLPRRLVNEGEVTEYLAGLGFDIIDPEGLEPATIARRAVDVPVIVAVEGSHLAHAIYTLAAGGALLVIQPPDRFAMPYKEVTDCLGMRFGFLVGEPAEGGFTADRNQIREMLERLS